MLCEAFGEEFARLVENSDSRVVAVAREIYHRQGEVEVDEHTVVSGNPGTDEGWYVMAWVWVPKGALHAG